MTTEAVSSQGKTPCVCVRVHVRADLVLVHPHVRQPQGIVGHGVLTPWGAVGSPLPKDVSHSGAGQDEQLATTHPDLHTHTGLVR